VTVAVLPPELTQVESQQDVTRRVRICYLLDHWDDIFSPPVGGEGTGGGDGTAHLSPMVRHRSVLELQRCLVILKAEAPRQHDHLKAFYTAEWRTVRTAKFHSLRGKWRQIANPRSDHEEDWDRRRERIVPGWVKLDKVRRGERRLCELFQGVVFLPEPLWEALMLSSAEIDAKERARRAGRRSA
jgi:hypothetical protein